jgi:putative membrane protein
MATPAKVEPLGRCPLVGRPEGQGFISPLTATVPSTGLGQHQMGILIRIVVNALAIVVAAKVIPGIELNGVLSALAAGLVLGVVNGIVRPILVFFTLPLTLLTLGLFLLVLNGLCLWLTSALVTGFEIHGFWAAVFGALLVSLVSWVLNAFLNDQGDIQVMRR